MLSCRPPGARRERPGGDANAPDGIGYVPLSFGTFRALLRADVLTIKRLAALCADGSLTDLPRLAPKRLEEAQETPRGPLG